MSGVTTASPQLDIAFRHHPVRGTWLDRRKFRWPYTLSRGFRAEAGPAHMLMLIVQTVSGAIQAEDRLSQRIHVGAGAAARILTQGATPVHRAPAGLSSRDEVLLQVEPGGTIEYLPELRILFPDASLEQRVCVQIAEGATALLADGFVLHDPGAAGHPFRRLASTLAVQGPDGALLAAERIDLAAPPRSRGRRAEFQAHGSLVLATCRAGAWLETVSEDATTTLSDLHDIYAAASPLPNDAGVVARIAAVDGRHLRLGLQAACAVFRRRAICSAPQQCDRMQSADPALHAVTSRCINPN